MTIAYFCVLIASFLPIIWIGIAKYSFGFNIKVDNKNPRDFLARTEGKSQRAKWAQDNAFEAFPAFAAAVIIASFVGVTQSSLNAVALIYISVRFLHGVFYILDWDSLRSLVWFAGWACNFTLYYLAWAV